MAKLQSFMLRSFSEAPKDVYNIEVPIGSLFRKCLSTPSGIIAIYEIPEFDVVGIATDSFKVLDNNESIPDNYRYIDIMDVIGENEDKEQVVILLPIYKLN